MIEVVLNDRSVRKLKRELGASGSKEIGGVLAAEQVGNGRFMVIDLSVQRNGTDSSFIRDPVQHRAFIQAFHERMGHQPGRFNYLGEWHSHPSYTAMPSVEDFDQMQSLVEDEEQMSTFLVLLVLKLDANDQLLGSAYGFRPGQPPVRGRLTSIENGAVREETSPLTRILATTTLPHCVVRLLSRTELSYGEPQCPTPKSDS